MPADLLAGLVTVGVVYLGGGVAIQVVLTERLLMLMVGSRKAIAAKNALMERVLGQARAALEREDEECAHRTIDWYFKQLEDIEDETPLDLIGLPSRTCRILEENEITSVERLCQLSRDHLAEFNNLGALQIQEIVFCLSGSGLSLKKVI